MTIDDIAGEVATLEARSEALEQDLQTAKRRLKDVALAIGREKRCPNCGALDEDGATLCYRCGAALAKEPSCG